MRIILTISILLLAVGCCPIGKATSEAANATFDAVAPEWEAAFREKYADNPEKLKRREILLEEWKTWLEDLEKAIGDE